jgi:hypothetical protein
LNIYDRIIQNKKERAVKRHNQAVLDFLEAQRAEVEAMPTTTAPEGLGEYEGRWASRVG